MSRAERKRCAIYTRKSSEEGLEQDFNSLAAQREACEAYIFSQRSEGWTALPDRYDDGGFSGGNLKRPAMQRLLDVIDSEDVDIVVVYKVDRLTRSLADFAKLIERFDGHSVSVVAVTQPFNTTTSMGRLTLNVLLSFAQFEREITGERIRDKIAASKAKGMWMGGVVPLGYDLGDRKLVVNASEAEKVRHIYERYLALGSVYKLQQELHGDGIRSKARVSRDGQPRGDARFSRGALYPLLRNRLYIGEVTHQETSYPGQHDAIVDQDLFDAVQAKLNARSYRHKNEPAPVSILAGKLFDDQGNRLYPCHANRKGKRYRYYVSKTVMNGGKTQTRARWPAHSLEAFIRDAVVRHIGDPRNWLPATHHLPLRVSETAEALAQQIKKQSTGDPLLHRILERATLRSSGITFELNVPKLRASLELDDELEINARWQTELTVRSLHNGQRRVLAPGEPAQNSNLVQALADAHRWQAQLVSGKSASISELASEVGRDYRSIKRILSLRFLAPDLQLAILEGKQTEEMTLQSMTKAGKIPICFNDQRRIFGSSAFLRRLPKNPDLQLAD